jgi:hypothetical protein
MEHKKLSMKQAAIACSFLLSLCFNFEDGDDIFSHKSMTKQQAPFCRGLPKELASKSGYTELND